MSKREIIEKAEREALDLLRFAMEKRGVDPRLWHAALSFDELAEKHDGYCIFKKEDRRWDVGYTEDGDYQEMGNFNNVYTAMKFLIWQFYEDPIPARVRKEWEDTTGQTAQTGIHRERGGL